jgi:hypothetical protein
MTCHVFCLVMKRELAHSDTYSLPFNSVTKYLCRTEYRRVISFPLWKYKTPRQWEGLLFYPSPPPILLVGRKAKFSFKGTVSLNSVTDNVFNLFSMFGTEQIYFLLFVKDLYYYSFLLFLLIIKENWSVHFSIKCHLYTVSHSIYIYRSV